MPAPIFLGYPASPLGGAESLVQHSCSLVEPIFGIKMTNLKGETNGNASGTFDLTFGGGDKVTGSFNATYCDIRKLPTVTPNCE